MGKYFGTDGVRGIANKKLTAAVAYRIGRFIGQCPQERKLKILIARDTRISGDMLLSALISGILSSGSDVYDEGISTTPSVSYLVKKHHFDFGIMISASHNPYYDNGIKLFNREGEKINSFLEQLIENYIDQAKDDLPLKENSEIGQLIQNEQLIVDYIDFLSLKALDLSSIKVLVDCANGSASAIAPNLFRKLNIQAKFINSTPNGININDRCGSTHLNHLISEMKNDNYDLGLAFDGDADRLLVVDAKGNIIDGDAIMYLNAVHLHKMGKLANDTIVVTSMSNIGLHRALSKLHIALEITDVGDKYVQARLKEKNLTLGGEQSGHIIFLEDLNTGDGILTAIKIMNILVSTKQSLDFLLKKLVIYPQILTNVTVVNKNAVLEHEGLKRLIQEEEKKLNGNGRILIRPSGTEPLVRVMCEAETLTKCQQVVQVFVEFINSIGY